MIGGTRRPQRTLGNGYDSNHKMYRYAQSLNEAKENIWRAEKIDFFDTPKKAYNTQRTYAALEEEFLKDWYDPNEIDSGILTIKEAEEKISDAKALFENDIEAMNEHTVLADYNAIVAMAPFIHKNILMNMVWEEAITKVTAVEPIFSMRMYFRFLVTPDGEEIDMFTDQAKIGPAMLATNPWQNIDLDLPHQQSIDIIAKLGGGPLDDISVDTYIGGIYVENVYVAEGDLLPNDEGVIDPDTSIKADASSAGKYGVWYPTELKFVSTYGTIDTRIITQEITLKYKTMEVGASEPTITTLQDTIFARTIKGGKFEITAVNGNISKVRLRARLDTSNAMYPMNSVKWSQRTDEVRIGNAPGLSTTISPQELKDLAAIFGVNQVTEIMDLYNTVLAETRDYSIKKYFYDDWKVLDPRVKFQDQFDWAPPENSAFSGTPLEWRRDMFMDRVEDLTAAMATVLNDPNITYSFMADPRIVNKITPASYTYQAPSSIGPIELDFSKTVCTSNKKVFKWLGTDKLRDNDEIMILINPHNTERCIYRMYEYQLYMSNEIRSNQNPALPNVYAFDRYLLHKYQPIQGRMRILNRSGIRGVDYVKTTGMAEVGN